jgi:hypothetical protein
VTHDRIDLLFEVIYTLLYEVFDYGTLLLMLAVVGLVECQAKPLDLTPQPGGFGFDKSQGYGYGGVES